MRSAAPQVGGTITPYHMMLTRTDWLGWGLQALHVLHAGDQDREGPRRAAQGRDLGRVLLLPRHGLRAASGGAKKLSVNGIPGLFNAPVAIETYAQVFEEEGALDKLEAFASLNGPKHYRLPPNEETITLEKVAWTAPEEVKIDGPGREGAGLSRRRDHRVESGGELKSDLVIRLPRLRCRARQEAQTMSAVTAFPTRRPSPS